MNNNRAKLYLTHNAWMLKHRIRRYLFRLKLLRMSLAPSIQKGWQHLWQTSPIELFVAAIVTPLVGGSLFLVGRFLFPYAIAALVVWGCFLAVLSVVRLVYLMVRG
ncbi:MAG: hypothetical protein AAFY20_23380 [Cyanobacteria bacterium J06639_14]